MLFQLKNLLKGRENLNITENDYEIKQNRNGIF